MSCVCVLRSADPVVAEKVWLFAAIAVHAHSRLTFLFIFSVQVPS